MPRLVAILIALFVPLAIAFFLLVDTGTPRYTYHADKAVYHNFNSELAFAHLKKLVEFGPRPAGSEALEASRKYLEDELAKHGWATERQMFDDDTPIGRVSFVNLRARYLGKVKRRARLVVLADAVSPAAVRRDLKDRRSYDRNRPSGQASS